MLIYNPKLQSEVINKRGDGENEFEIALAKHVGAE